MQRKQDELLLNEAEFCTPKTNKQKNLLLSHLLHTCTGEMASRLLALGGRPLGITPGGGCLALFTTLLQLATMVRIVSDSSCDTLLMEKPSHFY